MQSVEDLHDKTKQEIMQREYLSMQAFWNQIKGEMSDIDSISEDFTYQEFNYKNGLLKAYISNLFEVCHFDRHMEISEEALIVLSKMIEVFVMDMTMKAQLETQINYRTDIKREDVFSAVNTWDMFDVFALHVHHHHHPPIQNNNTNNSDKSVKMDDNENKSI